MKWMSPLVVRFAVLLMMNPAVSWAAEIHVGVSSQETYVGLPITLEVRIGNATKHEVPEIEPVDGLSIEPQGIPQRHSQTTLINGRRSHFESIEYRWTVTPDREGRFTIPPIHVQADGMASITKAVRIEVSKSATGDLMFVDLDADQEEVFVGQPIEMTLEIYIKPFADPQIPNQVLSGAEMWSLFSDQTDWGPFTESLEEMQMNRQQPRGRQVLRKDSEGIEQEYLLYKINATIYPDRPGPIEVGKINLVMNYPVTLAYNRRHSGRRSPLDAFFGDDDFPTGGSFFDDSFFRGMMPGPRITKFRPIVGRAELASVKVKPVPTKGRPDDYRGAVGRYVIATQAGQVAVKAGDPIELKIGIRGTGPMELVQAPPLAIMDEVTRDFKVSDAPLPGFVQGDQKVFTTTLRPRNENVTEIPAIALTFFNPSTGEYETSYSDPIAIQVEPAEVLALSRAMDHDTTAPVLLPNSKNNGQPNSASGISPLQADHAWVIPKAPWDKPPHSPGISIASKLAIALPPLLFFIAVLTRWFSASRWRSASRHRTIRLIQATDAPQDMAAILARFLAASSRVPAFTEKPIPTTFDEIMGHLRSAGDHPMAIRMERWRDQHRHVRPTNPDDIERLRDSAIAIVQDFHVSKHYFDLSSGTGDSKPSLKTKTKTQAKVLASCLLMMGVGGTGGSVVAEGTDTGVMLSDSQRQALLERSATAYQAATRNGWQQGDENLQVTESLQVMVESGVREDAVYFNLANAQSRTGKPAHAIANYLRALQINPTVAVYRRNLLAAQQTLSKSPPPWWQGWLQEKLAVMPTQTVKAAAWLAWAMFWLMLGLHLRQWAFPWKSASCAAMVIALVGAGLIHAQRASIHFPHHVVITAASVELRSGDGDSFPEVTTLHSCEGEIYRWKDRRSGWLLLETDDAGEEWGEGWIEGWVQEEALEVIS